ncbi:MAG: hypothetical protein L0Y57_07650 [Beijerinckiaceae bacterium]|nr:hypothetical protein [Beijerinckiaceae bacterium]
MAKIDYEIAGIHAQAPAEELFFAQYRLWLAAHATQNSFYLDCAFQHLLDVSGHACAKDLYRQFRSFTLTLLAQSRRAIGWRAFGCRCLGRDELLALKLVSASQNEDAGEEDMAAAELLACAHVRPLVNSSRLLAQTLVAAGFVLAPVEKYAVAAALPPDPWGQSLH